ncbi:MAG: DUF3368 domain-containing protein [Pseudomonadota bacterium]
MSGVVADTGPLIALAKIGLLALPSRLCGQTILPETVLRECQIQVRRADAQIIAAAIEAETLTVQPDVDWPLTHAKPAIDSGELAALSLALHLKVPLLLDESRGRKAARRFGVPLIGVCGLLLAAKREGWIGDIAPLLDVLRRQGYYISDNLCASVLVAACESP